MPSSQGTGMTRHLLQTVAITGAVLLAILYPFFPGRYDGWSVGLSMVAQVIALSSLLVVVPGLAWLLHQLRSRRRTASIRSSHRFAVASAIGASIAAVASIIGAFSVGKVAGVLMILLVTWAAMKVLPRVRRARVTEPGGFDVTPVYLVVVPLLLLVAQLALARPAAAFSRDRAIAHSAELIGDIERHRQMYGRYPTTTAALWPDYLPMVVGIEKYLYAARGESYDLYFEQPRLLLDVIGTREVVVYNPIDAHVLPSHASWNMLWTPEVLATRQGSYGSRAAGQPHWRSFLFD